MSVERKLKNGPGKADDHAGDLCKALGKFSAGCSKAA